MKGRSITFDGLRRSPNRFMRLIQNDGSQGPWCFVDRPKGVCADSETLKHECEWEWWVGSMHAHGGATGCLSIGELR